MSNIKGFLYVTLGVLGLLLVQFWFQQSALTTTVKAQPPHHIEQSELSPINKNGLVSIENDTIKVTIDSIGGKVVKTELKSFYRTIKQKEFVELFGFGKTFQYFALSGYQGDEALKFSITKQTKDVLEISAKQDNMVHVKRFDFSDTPYTIKQTNSLRNESFNKKDVRSYTALLSMHESAEDTSAKKFHPGEIQSNNGGWLAIPTYAGASYFTEDKPFTKLTYAEIQKGFQPKKIVGGWFALQTRYFLNAWIPYANSTNTLQAFWDDGNGVSTSKMVLQMIGPSISVNPDQQIETIQQLYSGPEIEDILHSITPGLDLTIDYGWLWLLSHWMFWLMEQFHTVVQNWGITIILITALIKVVFYSMSEKAYISGLKMKKIQPRIKNIQEKFKDDPDSKNKAILEIYQKEKINPVGGCLPLFIQLPFLVALYWVLIESVQLRHASFLWIPDLASYDPLYILPVTLGLGMFLQQKMTPTALDPAQEKAMLVVPFMMTFLFSRFPSGLALYMLTNAFLTALQQWFFSKKYNK
ncbi:MAG: hypothetical protein CMF41_01520 [Legionellales bacterium]|nr:hypothetical protein [Legionellales bacterium]OUX66136.1 MAG: hypothetical protein CBE41_00730 [Gammaproteobacteria bacterium TMED281]|tara:strand:+ start:1120 stop:2700 length:1581 start_codon:yes stop_codon:yes gene_type:complete